MHNVHSLNIDIIMPVCTAVFDTFQHFPVMFCQVSLAN